MSRVIRFALVSIALIPSTTVARGQNYVLDRVTVVAGSGSLSSTTLESKLIVGQESPGGGSSACNSGYRTSLGFWSVSGEMPVPIELAIRRSLSNPQDIELSWTGADPLFGVYRDSAPTDVANPVNLYHQTGLCVFTDEFAAQDPILFYLVLVQP